MGGNQMELDKRNFKILKWITRILASTIIIVGLPFYFGYGNPLPFINPEYSMLDNMWLTVFLFMFIGLGLGWRWPKIAGLLITIPILVGFIVLLIAGGGIPLQMLIPFVVGVLYIVVGSAKVIDLM
jgi:hypothetical protein